MLTRCPNCQTTFRVAPEQIRARHGRVRCGECMDVFNALDTLVDEPVTVAAPPEPPARQESASPVVDTSDAVAAEPPTGDASASPEPSVGAVPPPLYFGPADIPPVADDSTHEVPDAIVEPASGGDLPESATARAPESPDEAEPAPSAPADAEQPQPEVPPAPPTEEADAPAAAPLADDEAIAAAALAAVATAQATTTPRPAWRPTHAERTPAAPEDDEPSLDALPYDTAATRPLWRSLLLLFGIALAVVALLFQAALHWRVELVTLWPAARPLFAEACEQLGCALELPRKVALIGIESSDLHPDAGDKKRLVLRATLRNRAPFAQAWPHLELTVTDTADRALARRVLTPNDYLPPATRAEAGIAAHADAVIERALAAMDADAAGYRLYLFYP